MLSGVFPRSIIQRYFRSSTSQLSDEKTSPSSQTGIASAATTKGILLIWRMVCSSFHISSPTIGGSNAIRKKLVDSRYVSTGLSNRLAEQRESEWQARTEALFSAIAEDWSR